jgi:hypothetical protein
MKSEVRSQKSKVKSSDRIQKLAVEKMVLARSQNY